MRKHGWKESTIKREITKKNVQSGRKFLKSHGKNKNTEPKVEWYGQVFDRRMY